MIRKIVVLGALVVAWQRTPGWSQINLTKNSPLQLRARLVGQYYCHQPGSDQVEVVLKLELKFANTGDDSVILYRKCDRLLRLSRGRTLSDAVAGKYEDSSFFSETFTVPHIVSGTETIPPQNYFVIIPPGEPYFLNTILSFSYCLQPRKGCSTMEPGEHYAQAVYATWMDTLLVGKRLRKVWEPFGYLWFEALSLEPLRFEVATPTSIGICPVP
jgi:hypothetical protein